ncbi:MAG TPA: carbamate kinase [Candidatus Fraserbacteria bacterium]|nr:carbamate kinase [Candidatus Fraserbacteria bacterium]
MTKDIVVIALGGNAILQPGQQGSFEEQLANVRLTCEQLAQMVLSGRYKIVITHGNGPQVGNILLQNEAAKQVAVPMPLSVCGAESQGLIGYMIQQSLHNILARQGRGDISIATVVTQVVVDEHDPAFEHPIKPVGPFYSEAEAKTLAAEKGYRIKEDAGRGWRRVVPSPEPLEIFEKEAICALLEDHVIVIASGGGGIPVIRQAGGISGVEAVIDKDLAGERLAEDVKAKIFLVLTDVEEVKLNYNTPEEQGLRRLSLEEALRYHAQRQFAKGSMGPKVRAAICFIKAGGSRAIITSLNHAVEALAGQAGTTITAQ